MSQKDICIYGSLPIYNVKSGKNRKIVGYLPRGAILKYEGGGYVIFRKIKGYTSLTDRLCPVNSNGWVAAVSKVSKKIPSKPNGAGTIKILQNEIIRVLPSSSKNGWVRCAVENDGWFWSFYIKTSDYIRADKMAYDNIAKFSTL
ncbi:hypothetical protein ACW0UG_001916 [Listeria monocytogenes]